MPGSSEPVSADSILAVLEALDAEGIPVTIQQARRIAEALQGSAVPATPRPWSRWEPERIEDLTRRYQAGQSTAVIAAALGATYKATEQAITRFGLRGTRGQACS